MEIVRERGRKRWSSQSLKPLVAGRLATTWLLLLLFLATQFMSGHSTGEGRVLWGGRGHGPERERTNGGADAGK